MRELLIGAAKVAALTLGMFMLATSFSGSLKHSGVKGAQAQNNMKSSLRLFGSFLIAIGMTL